MIAIIFQGGETWRIGSKGAANGLASELRYES